MIISKVFIKNQTNLWTLTFLNCFISSASSLALSNSRFIVNWSLLLEDGMLALSTFLRHKLALVFDDLAKDKLFVAFGIISGVVGLIYGRISCFKVHVHQTKFFVFIFQTSKNITNLLIKIIIVFSFSFINRLRCALLL